MQHKAVAGCQGSPFNMTERACAEMCASATEHQRDVEEIIFMTCPQRAEQFKRFGRERAQRRQSYVRTVKIMKPRVKSPRGYLRIHNRPK